MNLLNSTFQRS